MEQKQYEDSTKDPIVQEIIMSNRIGVIAVELSKRLNIEPVRALQLFYESNTCADLHDKSTGLYLYGDLYVADEFMREMQEKQ
ncbi:MAG: hypothetical protein II603_04560 [Muribaculaceae bacterium]|jgi:hypothetical protein|nr:hypothetical protein [Muribaculaceae bacterium]MBQ4007790.1 hypothetical protein [Muribaculaceae bacterium]